VNAIKNCPITEQDVDLAVKIYGHDIAFLKRKTTRRKPIPVVQDVVSVPPEVSSAQRDVELSIDTIFVNGMSFLTTISSHIRYRTALWVPNRTVGAYSEQLKVVLALYKRAGFTVKLICADQEFKATLEGMRDTNEFQPNTHVHKNMSRRQNATIAL
jgi:hypothetical protein